MNPSPPNQGDDIGGTCAPCRAVMSEILLGLWENRSVKRFWTKEEVTHVVYTDTSLMGAESLGF